MDSQVGPYGQNALPPVGRGASEKQITAKQLMEPARGLSPFTADLPVRDPAKLAKLAEHSPVLRAKVEEVAEFGIANSIAALWTLTAEHNLQLPVGGDLVVAKALLPQVADLVKKQM